MYRIGERKKDRRRQIIKWVIFGVVLLLAMLLAYYILHQSLRPNTTVHQAAAITKVINYKTMTQKYSEPDFTIDIPASWSFVTRPAGPYKTFTWQSGDRVTDGQQIEIYEDTIPANFAVNRVLVVAGNEGRLSLDGAASDNCLTFTKNDTSNSYQVGAAARWQGVSFWCDQDNVQRDVVGTSSTDGINTVILSSQQSKTTHKFFFTYTDYAINPDYSVFYNALNSLRMK